MGGYSLASMVVLRQESLPHLSKCQLLVRRMYRDSFIDEELGNAVLAIVLGGRSTMSVKRFAGAMQSSFWGIRILTLPQPLPLTPPIGKVDWS